LPDPVARAIDALCADLTTLRTRVVELEARLADSEAVSTDRACRPRWASAVASYAIKGDGPKGDTQRKGDSP